MGIRCGNELNTETRWYKPAYGSSWTWKRDMHLLSWNAWRSLGQNSSSKINDSPCSCFHYQRFRCLIASMHVLLQGYNDQGLSLLLSVGQPKVFFSQY